MLTKVLHFSDICKKAARFCTNSLVQRKGKREKRKMNEKERKMDEKERKMNEKERKNRR